MTSYTGRIEELQHVSGRMKRMVPQLFLTSLLLLLSCSWAGAVDSITDFMAKGDRYYAERAEGHQGEWASTGPISMAMASYLEAYDRGSRSPEVYEKILKTAFFYATNAERDEARQREILQKAIDIGTEGIELYPDNVALNYQMAGSWGRWGEVNGIFASARKGVADKVKSFGEKAVTLDPDYAEGGGYRTMGRLHFKAPYIPFILAWPDKKESLKNLALAVEKGPHNLTNHLFYAETLFDARDYDKALEHLQIILAAGLHDSKIVEELKDKKEAESLKKIIEAKIK